MFPMTSNISASLLALSEQPGSPAQPISGAAEKRIAKEVIYTIKLDTIYLIYHFNKEVEQRVSQ